uniref:Uncharacterized protein n=1 Tax=Salmo trutta TaxID=8032 RepID=A0A673WZZ0_SALTR
MSSETPENTVTVKAEPCQHGERNIHRQIWKEYKEEMFVHKRTLDLFYNMFRTNDLVPPAAWILGYAVGKASYVPTCRNKHCHHVCEECKRQQVPAAPAPTENMQS